MSGIILLILIPVIIYLPIRLLKAKKLFEEAKKYIEHNYPGFSSTHSITSGTLHNNRVQINFPRYAAGSIKIITNIPIRSPYIYLDAHTQETDTLTSSEKAFAKEYRVSLEGDFDKYMHLYTRSGDIPYSLSILAPNFMQALIEHSARFDVEFYENNLSLTLAGTSASNPKTLGDALECLIVLLDHINKIADTYRAPSEAFQKIPSKINLASSTGYDNETRRYRIPGRHILGLFVFIYFLGGMVFYTYKTSRLITQESSNTKLVMVTLITGLFFYSVVYFPMLLLGAFKLQQPKVIFKLSGIAITMGWLLLSVVLILFGTLLYNAGFAGKSKQPVRYYYNETYQYDSKYPDR